MTIGADFVIITALPEEQDALHKYLDKVDRVPPDDNDVRTHFKSEIYAASLKCSYEIITLSVNQMGRVKAANATNDAIKRWQPRYVILVGIAAGVEDNGLKLGDLVIPEQIVDYEVQKLEASSTLGRHQYHRADPRLWNFCNNLRGDSIQKLVTLNRPKQGSTTIICEGLGACRKSPLVEIGSTANR